MSDEKKLPKRRFKQFLNTPSWEQRKLGEITEIITKGTTPIDKSGQGEISFIKVENIDQFNCEIKSCTKITKKEHEGYLRRSQLKSDDILFSIAGTLGRIGVVTEDILPANTNQALAIIRLSNGDVKYITKVLGSKVVEEYIRKNPTVGAQPNLSLEQVSNLIIPYPSDEEQIKLGDFFKALDNLITLHQRKLNKLEKLKKAYLEELFPDGNQCKPKRRFKEFKDDWEQRKLGEIATVTGGGTPSTNISEYWNGDIDWYSPVEIGENRYVSGSIRKITKLGLEKSSAKILPVGTVLFTSRAGIGNTAILEVEGCTNQGFQSITPNLNELDTYFLYTMTPKLKRYGEITGAGSTFVEVSGKQMEQMNLMVPSLEEQKRVGELFKTMDDAITLHQRKLQKLKKLKAAYLEDLFV